jgi:phage-related protein
MATALAAAKTKARQMGIDEQIKMLGTMTDAASKFYSMGTSAGGLASQVQGQAADAQKGAAGIISDIGQQIGSAGNLQSNVGQLYAAGANIFGSAADIEKGYLALTNDAYKGLSDAYGKAANYYLGAADAEVRANTSGGGVGSHGVQFAHIGLGGEVLRPGMVW